MALISGPRQVGKTTLARTLLLDQQRNYFNWDDDDFKVAWSRHPLLALANRGPGPVVLDEIHKDRRWKSRLKGVYDKSGADLPILVTGSAKLDIFRKGGDSLMGRYIPYRLAPFSVAESGEPIAPDEAFTRTKVNVPWADLTKLSGFPEPLFKGSEAKAKRWSRLRLERLIHEDIRDIRAVNDLQALTVLMQLLPKQVGSLLSINSLRQDVGVAYGTAYAWVNALELLYHHFVVRPYAGKLSRALKAEPKIYLFDTLPLQDNPGALRENLLALHLRKACQFWTDSAAGEFDLRFIRNKEKQEVDFCVLRDGKVWLLVECKSGAKTPTPALIKFTEALKPTFSFQLVSQPVDSAYAAYGIRVCSYERFCAGLV